MGDLQDKIQAPAPQFYNLLFLLDPSFPAIFFTVSIY